MQLKICPNCNSRKIKILMGTMTFQTAKGAVTVPNVTREKCENCGEEFFDHAANAVLDQYRPAALKPRRVKKLNRELHALQQ